MENGKSVSRKTRSVCDHSTRERTEARDRSGCLRSRSSQVPTGFTSRMAHSDETQKSKAEKLAKAAREPGGHVRISRRDLVAGREACRAQRAEGPGGPGTPRPTSGPPGRRAAQTPGQTGLLCSAAVTSHARWGPPRGEGPVPTRNAKSQRRDGHREARRTVRVRAPAPAVAGGESLITPARRLTGKEVKITTQRSVFLRYTL